MAKLQCEVCGGKLMGKPGGIFECEYCGMEYDTAWAKEKIQEIKGTVKVEGTVQVAGTVKVEGGINVEGLLKRAQLALEDSHWRSADEYCEKVLDIDPECAQAYLLKLMAELHVRKQDDLRNCEKPFDDKNSYQKAIRFGDAALRDALTGYIAHINNRCRQQEEIRRKKAAEAHRLEQEAQIVLEEHKKELRLIRQKLQPAQKLLSAGLNNTIGVKRDGTVVAVGYNGFGACNVSDWTEIVAVSARSSHTVGLKANGTVVITKPTGKGGSNVKYNVSDWTDISAISIGAVHIVGLRASGSVLAIGPTYLGLSKLSGWRDIIAISAGDGHTVGLKADGTVVATGDADEGACNVSGWRDIVAISAGESHTVGLKSDGTVVATGRQSCGQCNVSGWKDIVAISAGDKHTVGLKADGTVVVTKHVGKADLYTGQGEVSDWKDIIAISAGGFHTVGLKADGTVVSTKYIGDHYHGQCDVSQIKLFSSFESLGEMQDELRLVCSNKVEAARIANARRAEGLCQHCGGEFKGLFSKKCVSCGKPKDY